MAEHRLLTRPEGTLAYLVAGQGPETVLLFHGAGQSKEVFPIVKDEACLNQFTFYSFDLFFHGESIWSFHKNTLTKNTWGMFMNDFFEKEKLSSCGVLAFSLGARFALTLAECHPTRINRLILLAPDGLRFHFLYRLAVGSRFMRSAFRWLMNHPHTITSLRNISYRTGLINKTENRLVEKQLESPEKRNSIYSSWVVFRALKFDIKALADLLIRHKISVAIYTAANDTFINKKAILQFSLSVHGHYQELNTHHLGILRECKSILIPIAKEV